MTVTDNPLVLLYIFFNTVQAYSVVDCLFQDSLCHKAQENRHHFYHPRNPVASPFFRLVEEHFDEFELVYPRNMRSSMGFGEGLSVHLSISLLNDPGDHSQHEKLGSLRL